MVRWCTIGDGDGHIYIIPADRRSEFRRIDEEIDAYWSDPDEGDEKGLAFEFPEWVRRIDGGILTFERPEIGGKPLGWGHAALSELAGENKEQHD